jgi:hypothetical protein
MNLRIIILTVLSSLFLSAAASYEENDSTNVTSLEEVTVTAKDIHLSAGEGITFIPDSRQKKSSAGGYQLLYKMDMPLVNVDMFNGEVKSLAGIDASLYINGIEASPREVAAIYCKDVRKVVYYDNPVDPKYQGAKLVIDFITAQYEYGGYTNLNLNQTLPEPTTNASGYSKLSYKRMTYDISVGYGHSSEKHGGESMEEYFDLNGNYRFRESDPTYYKEKNHNYYGTFRATYIHNNLMVSNILSFDRVKHPLSELMEKVGISENMNDFNWANSERSSNSTNSSLGWSMTSILNLKNGWSVNFIPKVNYGRNNANSTYLLDNLSINTFAKETNWKYNISMGSIKTFPNQHALVLTANFNGAYNKVRYTGNRNEKETLNWNLYALNVAYTLQNQRMSIVPDVGFNMYHSKIGSVEENRFYVNAHLNSQFLLNDKNYLMLSLQYNTLAPGINEKSEITLRQDELIWFKGNPNLTTYPIYQAILTHLWLPSNKFTLSSSFFVDWRDNRILRTFVPYSEGIIRLLENNGSYVTSNLNLRGTWSLLNKSLSLSAQPSLNLNASTGVYHKHIWSPSISLAANYYISNLFFNLQYRTGSKNYYSFDMAEIKSPDTYELNLGWSNSDWNINLRAANFFRYSWKGEQTKFQSPAYSYIATQLSGRYHASFQLSITYNFSYGKKVQKGDEVRKLNANESAISNY